MKTTPKLKPFARKGTAAEAPKAGAETTPDLQASIDPTATQTGTTTTEDTTMSTPKAPTTPAKIPATPAAGETAELNADGTTTEIKAEAKYAGPVAATFAELKAAFGEDPAFVMQAQEKGWTMPQAFAEQNKVLRAQNAALKTGKDRLANAGDAGVPAIGTNPNASGGGSIDFSGSTPADYQAAVTALANSEKIPPHEAVAKINREQPEFRKRCFGGNPRRGV